MFRHCLDGHSRQIKHFLGSGVPNSCDNPSCNTRPSQSCLEGIFCYLIVVLYTCIVNKVFVVLCDLFPIFPPQNK